MTNFISFYSGKLLSLRQKILLVFTISICVAAFLYSYFATEFVTKALETSIADSSPHVRLYLSSSQINQLPEMLSGIRETSGVIRADKGEFTTTELRIITRKQQEDFDKPGEVFYAGTKEFKITAYPFDSQTYIPPILMENVYSKINRERMNRKPEDEPIRIITDPDENESKINWVIINDNVNVIFPLGPSWAACQFDVSSNYIPDDKPITLYTAGYLMDSPLNITSGTYSNNIIYTKPSVIEKLAPEKDRQTVIDISIKNRQNAEQMKRYFQEKYSIEKAESWLDANASAVPFLDGLKITVCIGVFSIVVLSIIGVFIVITMLVLDKTKQLAIVYAIGLKATQLRLLFLYIGMRIGAFSLIIGFTVAFIAAYLSLSYWKSIVENFCWIPKAELSYSPVVLVVFALTTFALCCLASWLPTRSLVTNDPIHNLRNE